MKICQHAICTLLAILATATLSPAAQAQKDASEVPGKKLLAEGATAKDFQLKAVAGQLKGQVRLSEVNRDGPVVVVVLRGFPDAQCPACTAQVDELIGKAEQFAAKKAKVLLLYPGSATQLGKHADEFLHGTTLPPPFTFLLDPGYQFTNSYGLRWDAPRETAYPSTIVVDASGKITFVKISQSHGGRTKAKEILSAL